MWKWWLNLLVVVMQILCKWGDFTKEFKFNSFKIKTKNKSRKWKVNFRLFFFRVAAVGHEIEEKLAKCYRHIGVSQVAVRDMSAGLPIPYTHTHTHTHTPDIELLSKYCRSPQALYRSIKLKFKFNWIKVNFLKNSKHFKFFKEKFNGIFQKCK